MKRTLYICLAAGILLFLAVKCVPAPNQPSSGKRAGLQVLAEALSYHEHQSSILITNWDQAKRHIDLSGVVRALSSDQSYNIERHFTFAPPPQNTNGSDSLVLFQNYPENSFSWKPNRFAVVRTGNSVDVRLLSDLEISRLLHSDSWKVGLGFRPVTVALAVSLISGAVVLIFRAYMKRKRPK